MMAESRWMGAVRLGIAVACGIAIGCSDGKGDDESTTSATTASSTTTSPDKDRLYRLSHTGVGDGVGEAAVLVSAAVPALGVMSDDGWLIRYEKLVVSVGDVVVGNDVGDLLSDATVWIIDVRSVPSVEIARFSSIPVGHYGPLAFTLEAPDKDSPALADAEEEDLMVTGGLTVHVAGSIESPLGMSCNPNEPADCATAGKVTFHWSLRAQARFAGCEGFDVERDQVTVVALKLALDTWFLTGFTSEASAGPRLAQWIADADLDRDGETTLDELAAIKAAIHFPPDIGYDFSGANITLETALDIVAAQTRMIGVHPNACNESQLLE